MKKKFYMLIVAMAMPLLSGCFGKGSSADPPANFAATAGDGRVILTWDAVPNIDFWIFTATSPSLTAFNWTGLPNAHAYIRATTPFYVCGLYNGTYSDTTKTISPLPYYFAANGRSNGGPGGTSTPTVNATPYNASEAAWTTGSTTPTTPNIFGVGYAGLTTCASSTTSADGIFAAVGAGGAIFTGTFAVGSPYTMNWISQNAPAGFTTDLHAVTGYAAHQNNTSNPQMRWMAVGAGKASIYSIDGINWYTGTPENPGDPTLNSLTQVSGYFVAAGDSGTIITGRVPSTPSITTGITWTTRTSNTTNNLNAVTHGSYYVAVGDSGTILTSSDASSWSVKTPITSSNLRGVAASSSIIVAVGDSGTIVTSKDNGSTWTLLSSLAGATNFVGVAVESQTVEHAPTDSTLSYVSKVQFVAVDDSGNAFTSQNGFDWTGPISTGTTSLNSLVGSGFGYVAAGNNGITAYAF